MSRKAGAADPALTRETAEDLANAGRLKQMRMVAGLIRKSDPKAIPIIVGSGLGVLVVLVVIGLLTGLAALLITVGRPGVILVGEGSPNRLASLLAAEKKRVARVAYEVPIFEFQVGNGEGQIPVSKLQRKIMRLPRNLKPAAVSDINHRLKALQPSLQAPKGPIPKNIRQPKMPRPKAR